MIAQPYCPIPKVWGICQCIKKCCLNACWQWHDRWEIEVSIHQGHGLNYSNALQHTSNTDQLISTHFFFPYKISPYCGKQSSLGRCCFKLGTVEFFTTLVKFQPQLETFWVFWLVSLIVTISNLLGCHNKCVPERQHILGDLIPAELLAGANVVRCVCNLCMYCHLHLLRKVVLPKVF